MIDHELFHIQTTIEFEKQALKTFRYQYANVDVYTRFVDHLGVNPRKVNSLDTIPFLPINLFKRHIVLGANLKVQVVFKSSGTTQSKLSSHYVHDLNMYKTSFTRGFEFFYGSITDYVIIALLPSYLEQGSSSLVYMVNDLIQATQNSLSGFYLGNLSELPLKLVEMDQKNQKVILIGVTYALLDLMALMRDNRTHLRHTIIMETGGMKGRRKEMVKDELHQCLKQGFGVNEIHSEYGMTELLSQAYAKINGVFNTPPWMKIFIRDTTDPLTLIGKGKSGGINIIDLSNYYSCSFISTHDLGIQYADETFSILGRFDDSDARGCNLLLA